MKCVLSFWTKPSLKDATVYKSSSGFVNQYYFACSFYLAFLLAKQWFKKVELVTDKTGYDFVIKKLKIPFDNVEVVLDEINDIHPELWAFGKLKAYSIQKEPFVHIDYDVFLFKNPKSILNSNIITQNVESLNYPFYANNIKRFNQNFKKLPAEWIDYQYKKNQVAYNVGIIGGQEYEALVDYAKKGMSIILDNYEEVEKFSSVKHMLNDFNVVYEQYFLSAYMYYHGLKVDTYINKANDNYIKGYTHALGSAKGDINNNLKIERMLRKSFPSINPVLNSLKTSLS